MMTEEVIDDNSSDGESFERWAEEASYGWCRKLWSYPLMVEGAAHGSSNDRGNCARKLDIRTCPLMVEEASDLCVGDDYAQRQWQVQR